ncbi:hypothetical protein GCM10011390_18780 [Aureimonas endophytica]|uniref:Uncharacterized protein n=1 Tax=Aureimonas endophytica TaxID=2027858 RepID=A0A917E3I8_9HYPH|nr:hypothetical protein [Aureimonas endophytica]GGE00220.1 hypothetical protein GCM10011390_18780 [Aureimonas endophytica]
MADEKQEWRPGSFTKNFSWGRDAAGLEELHETIRIGFAERMEDVPREEFRARISKRNRPDYIPMNYFLFTRQSRGEDYIVADELVFQALSAPHSARFDKLAMFTFLLSFAGKFKRANPTQRRPAMWANAYIREHIDREFAWDTRRISASDIATFVGEDERYKGETVGKLATNLNFIFDKGRIRDFPRSRIERWWVDALFLALDRIIEDRLLDRQVTASDQYASLLERHHFIQLTGRRTLEKEMAVRHLVLLYEVCGGRERFSDEAVARRTEERVPDVEEFLSATDHVVGAIHPKNRTILKSIPRSCALLARYAAGFEVIGEEELANFDIERFVRSKTKEAMLRLQERQIRPRMSADELMRITREK